MSKIKEILNQIEGLPGCRVLPPSPETSTDALDQEETIPPDLNEFFSLSSGLELFSDSNYPLFVHGPQEFVRANPLIVGEACEDDRSYRWFVVANDGQGEYLSLDLHPDRLGKCYDSFFDRHGIPGSCPIIATSFTDLLMRALDNRGQHWWWLRPGFVSLGDAYDD